MFITWNTDFWGSILHDYANLLAMAQKVDLIPKFMLEKKNSK